MAHKKGNNRGKEKKEIMDYVEKSLGEMDATSINAQKERIRNAISKIVFSENFKLKTDKQKEMIRAIHENEIIFVHGPAGTGKTLIAIKGALELLQRHPDKYNKITITKPIIEAAGETIGILPGDLKSKTDLYLSHFDTAFKTLISAETHKRFVELGIIEKIFLPYLRGISLEGIAILDEAQNTTKVGLKLFITRKSGGENGLFSKLIICGDSDQSDLFLRGDKNGLEDAIDRFKNIPKVAFVEFSENDIVRDRLLIDVLRRYRTNN